MWATAVVMRHPLGQDSPQRPLVQRDHVPSRRSQEAFIGAGRRREDAEMHRLQRSVYGAGVDGVAVVNNETVRFVAGQARPELLRRRSGARSRSGARAGGADVEHHEDVHEPEPGCHRYKKSHARPRERDSAETWSTFAFERRGRTSEALRVPSDRPRRDGDAQLEPQFGRNPFLSPRPIRTRHRSTPEVLGNRRTSTQP